MNDQIPKNTILLMRLDLGQLFQNSSAMALKINFAFIGDIFKGVFNLLILFLVFLQKTYYKVADAGFLGYAIGIYVDLNKDSRIFINMVGNPTLIVCSNCI